MPSCSIVTCKNRSESVSLANNGITFHRFPCKPEVKEKWIRSTGRGPVWLPSKRSTICSIHFKENEFRHLLKSRRLFDWAVPTKKLHHIPISPPHNSTKSNDIEALFIVQPDSGASNLISSDMANLDGCSKPSSSTDEVQTATDMKNAETPRELKMRSQIESYKSQIEQKNRKIRTLQKKNSRYLKRITDLKAQLKELRGKKDC